jgi:hypothetical protein
MSDPVATAAAAAAKPNHKPSKALPTDRVSHEKQLAVLRAYGAIAAADGMTAAAIGEVVQIHPSSVSVCNPFLSESGLIERSGAGNMATEATVAYHQATVWNDAAAGEKLAPTLRQTWYWKALQNRLSFRPMEVSEVIQVLAAECGASVNHKAQLAMVLDYLIVGGLVVKDGSQVKQGPRAMSDSFTPPPPPPGDSHEHERDREKGKPKDEVPIALAPGISFDACIRVTEKEIANWSPEQISEFFKGLAAVIAAKGRAE